VDQAQEIEVSVLGNEDPVASIPGEIIPKDIFYTFAEKYINDTAELLVPAQGAELVKEPGAATVIDDVIGYGDVLARHATTSSASTEATARTVLGYASLRRRPAEAPRGQ
ncbi:MAG: hypothetical protein ACP5KN_20185, partial [Armatimonadota bacterium]